MHIPIASSTGLHMESLLGNCLEIPGGLRIDCNEVGFTGENVEAICSISQSSKSSKTADRNVIGEKGIGFKSVFKAADVVWISSGDFRFKLDKTKPLGMITPIWAEFPEETVPQVTSMYLQFSQNYDRKLLIEELFLFDPKLLIFLRRIERIDIQGSDNESHIFNRLIRKTESYTDGDRVITVEDGEKTSSYLIRTHGIQGMPHDQKRPMFSQSELVLGFAISELSQYPQPDLEKVYAFLPIMEFGLKV
ncbi:hypothetical protein ACHAO9_007994 [Fusarium lateritium]